MMVDYEPNVAAPSTDFDSDEPNVKTTVGMSDSTRESLSARADSNEPSPASKPKNKWYRLENLGKQDRWHVYYYHTLSINSNYPDVIESINESFPLLPALAKTYIAIDRLKTIVPNDCLTSPEAMGYIIQFAEADPYRGRKYDTIPIWQEYLEETQRKVSFAPNFTDWDEDTKEIKGLAKDAIAASMRVLKEHKRAGRRLPKEVVDGIYVRTNLLQRWRVENLEQVRSRPDYKKWKAEQEAPPPPPISQLTQRRGYPVDGTATIFPPTTISRRLNAPKPHKRPSKPRGMELYFQTLQSGPSTWPSTSSAPSSNRPPPPGNKPPRPPTTSPPPKQPSRSCSPY
ncbi:hypothetical protein V490_06270 [Pseudogymnoascus sp. VKM F-3557]|nr:hypothetical protein V490_06270 [Pseudogymnoascus sp. VKM F-3557]